MGIFHYLNVKDGDCSIIQHATGHVTVFDVCNAKAETVQEAQLRKSFEPVLGNFGQKNYPVNPIDYMRERKINDVFRFILSHPEMDHMDGIKAFFEAFPPTNFWDTDNTCEKDWHNGSPYNAEDWEFYKTLRAGTAPNMPTRITPFAGARNQYFNIGADGQSGGDGLNILAPTSELLDDANKCGDFNDASYVVLYRSNAGRILLCGDSHDLTWEYILANYADDVKDVDLLIAPHHGRKSGRKYDFLDVVRPRLTFFGNADSEHLAYGAWNYRNLPVITNNQAGTMIVDTNGDRMKVYVTNQTYANTQQEGAEYSEEHGGYFIGLVHAKLPTPA